MFASSRSSSSQTSAPQSQYEDHRKPLARAARLGLIALVVITIFSLMLWGYFKGLPGIWGVLLGAAIGGGFVLMTALSVLITSNSDPSTTMAVVLGSWLLKVVVLVGVLFAIKGLTFYDSKALFVTLVTSLIVTLATEVWGIVTSQVTYVS